ncbi:hypothetical protein [Candidatus Binatus sp.]|uniref:hypothetical protein n=1 Tax=Candidatus Binatus sp. TaxID=2811406 RepID=UPI003C76F42C
MVFAAVVVCGSDGDRRTFADLLPNNLQEKGFCVRKFAGESQPWRWEGLPSKPTFAAPLIASDKIGVAIKVISKTEVKTVDRLAAGRESILCTTPLWPSDAPLFEAAWKHVWDKLE